MSSSLSMVESRLPPGFRFHPRDDELICDYLMKKIGAANYSSQCSSLLIDVDLNKCEPWDIPEIACVGGKEWYFYNQRDRKYATGLRTNRATVSGYWKATGKDRVVVRKDHLIGMRKTLVFYRGRAPKGRKTNWVMHEFRLEGPFVPPDIITSSSKEDWVLCRVFHKSGDQASIRPNTLGAQGDDSSHGHDETGSSTLPPLMDSYITFSQSPHGDHKNMNDDVHHHYNHHDNTNEEQDHDNSNKDAYNQHVPCFSIFSPNQTNTNTSTTAFSQIFSMDPSNSMLINNSAPVSYNFNYSSLAMLPTFGATSTRDGRLPNCSTTTANNYKNNNYSAGSSGGGGSGGSRSISNNGAINPLSACDDKQVIRAVLSQLTKTESSPNSKVNGSSPVSLGEDASSESYLSDVGLPTATTMWNNHY